MRGTAIGIASRRWRLRPGGAQPKARARSRAAGIALDHNARQQEERAGKRGMLVGYARVSTTEQETTLQLDALRRAGVQRVYWEKTSSVGQRPELHRALAEVGQGDVLLVYKLDRLARSLKDLLGLLDTLERRGCALRSLTEPVDTQSLAGRMMLQMLGAVAEFERGLIRERSMAGQRAAMERGIKCGRPRSMREEDEADLVRLYESGWFTMDVLADAFDVHVSSVKRAIYRVRKPGHSSLQ